MLSKYFKFSVLAVCVGFAPQLALARLDPSPPPSGVVVHLFGPGSVMDQMVPQSAAPAAAADTATDSAGAAKAAPAPVYVPPSLGDVMHQMFVTGDPNDPPKPSAGRVDERQ